MEVYFGNHQIESKRRTIYLKFSEQDIGNTFTIPTTSWYVSRVSRINDGGDLEIRFESIELGRAENIIYHSRSYSNVIRITQDNVIATTNCYSRKWFSTPDIVVNYAKNNQNSYKNAIKRAMDGWHITKVITSGPATIFFFKDGEKVVIKRNEGEPDDIEKAVALAFVRKLFGNRHGYYDHILEGIRLTEKARKKEKE